MYTIPWENAQSVPEVLLSDTGRLYRGDHFFYEDGTLYFFQDPGELFTDNLLLSEVTSTPANNWNHQLFGMLPTANSGDYTLALLRGNTSNEALKLALAEQLGLTIVKYGGALLQRQETPAGVWYTFEHDQVLIEYPHVRLPVGVHYAGHTIIGEEYFVMRTPEDPQWWLPERGVIGTYFNVPNLFPFPGQPAFLPNHEVPVYSISSDNGTPETTHVRFTVYRDRGLDDRLWRYIHHQETLTGNYLNHIIKLPAPPPKREVFSWEQPACWADVLERFERLNTHQVRGHLPQLTPEFSYLPDHLRGYCNPLDVVMRAGYGDLVTFIRIPYEKLPKTVMNLSKLIDKTRPVTRLRYIEFVLPDYSSSSTITGTSSVEMGPGIQTSMALSTTSSTRAIGSSSARLSA